MIEVRHSTSPGGAETASTADLRKDFLVEDLFHAGEVHGVYTHDDRLLVGGAVPGTGELDLPTWDVLGTSSHLERRELGIINVGGAGHVLVDGEKFELEHLDGLYVARGSEVVFVGAEAAFYFVSAPAHATYPTTALKHTEVEPMALGTPQGANERSLYRYAWGEELQTAVLQFGVTVIADGSVWNTFPPHLHDRRTEVYCYTGLEPGARVLHVMGEPGRTRHVWLDDGEAVISPSWSVHAGAATGSYAFIWAMAGENAEYTDLDPVPLETL